ncbi:MAG: L-ribulose-5-phosphate 3-epimerase [Clostridia bacterium]
MSKYTIGLYEKAMPNDLTFREKLECASRANYDYIEVSIDATEEKINRINMGEKERFELVTDIFETKTGIDSLCVSALTKYALGDLNEVNSTRGLEIIKGSIKLGYDIGARIIMIPGYDIYYGESTKETRAKYIENLKVITEIASKYGVVLGFETMENEFMNTTEKAMEYVNIINSSYLQVYPDCGNITNAIKTYGTSFADDVKTGEGHIVAMHLKETVPGKFREIPYGTGHVDFVNVIDTAWELGIRKFVTEFWDIGKEEWFDDVVFANKMMRDLFSKKESK